MKVLLEFAKKSYFLFVGQYYDKIDGVAMGSPLGPVLANIFMCDFEEKWVLNKNARPSISFRYADDTFTLFDSKNTATQFLLKMLGMVQNELYRGLEICADLSSVLMELVGVKRI